ncbi:MAG TPA: SDR family oxidoreductase [Methylovirgula sp.]|nr:SDR family oxidoreductase [Methylovirgula sp.]
MSNRGTALVTGASSGIGAVYADRLARRGYDLILVARRRERLDELARTLNRETGREVTPLTADLGNSVGLGQVEDVLRSDSRITALVNNAGFASVMPLLNENADKMEEMIELNVTALTRLTYAAIPGFVARGSGTIINISSIAAVMPELLNGVYGGTKAYVLAFSQSLRHELADKGVRVQVVLPGGTITELWHNAGVPGMPSERQEIFMPVGDMVDAALAGLDQGEFVTVPALPNLADWEKFEAARQALFPNLSHARPAARYRIEPRSAA